MHSEIPFFGSLDPYSEELKEALRSFEHEPDRTLRWLRALFRKGSFQSALWIARAYYSGHGVPRDDTEAEKWFRLACDTDSPQAQTAFGMFLIRKNRSEEAAAWLRKAADNNYPPALYALGFWYLCAKKPSTALPFLEKAARLGNLPARFRLALYKSAGVLNARDAGLKGRFLTARFLPLLLYVLITEGYDSERIKGTWDKRGEFIRFDFLRPKLEQHDLRSSAP